MCGIAGIYYKRTVTSAALDAAEAHFSASLRHRGPDAYGSHRTERSVFANLRLSIVDRAGGDQPIYAPCGKRGIVYNGEVYNWQALREHHCASDYTFHTQTDTESVLAAYLRQGVEAFEHFNGMFACCFWDDTSGEFVLVRDRFGAKPLYVYEDAHCLAFASELKTLLGLPDLDLALNPLAFQDYFTYRYVHAPYTFFKRIEKLPAGHWLRYRDGQREQHPFTRLEFSEPEQPLDEAAYLEELDSLMHEAVRGQLMGEVPIGVLLSGGLDSSAIASYVRESGAKLKTYNIGFPQINEFAFSREVAEQLDLEHIEICMTEEELFAGMDRTILRIDEPMADPACFALSRLCETIGEDVTVVLSGEGGDEMFAGYNQHHHALEAGLSREACFARFFAWSTNFDDASRWLLGDALPPEHFRYKRFFDQADTALNGMQLFELMTWMPENLMMKADKVLMAHSLEGRFPFLDNGIYRLASRLPQAMRLPSAQATKYLLRTLMKRKLPPSVLERPKMGFTVPPAFFLERLHGRFLQTLELLRGSEVATVVDLDQVRQLVEDYYAGREQHVFKVWNIFVLLFWFAYAFPHFRQQRYDLEASRLGATQWLSRARESACREQPSEALAQYELALFYDPADVKARLELAKCALACEDAARAEQVLQEGLKLSPNEAAYHCALGELFLRSGRREWAFAAAETALGIQPEYDEASRLLAKCSPDIPEGGAPDWARQPVLVLGGDYEILSDKLLAMGCPLGIVVARDSELKSQMAERHPEATQSRRLYTFSGEQALLFGQLLPKMEVPVAVCAEELAAIVPTLQAHRRHWSSLMVAVSPEDPFGVQLRHALVASLGQGAFALRDVGATRYVFFKPQPSAS